MPLTDTAIRATKPAPKAFKLADEKGLYLFVTPAGGKLWRYNYRFAGKRKTLALGAYPEISLANARDKLAEARKQLSSGIDPAAAKKAAKNTAITRAANSFEAVAREWYEIKKSGWVEAHGLRIIRRLEADIFKEIGSVPIAEVSAPALLASLRKIEKRKAFETAHRALQNCGQVFRYAIATGRAEYDPAQSLKGALTPVSTEHFPAVTDPAELAPLLLKLEAHTGTPIVCSALKLAPMLFVRPGELRNARWADVNLTTAEWRFTLSKTNTEHIVPLSIQAVAILESLKPYTEHSEFIFPSARSSKRPMSDNAVLAALRSLGIPADEMTGHGFRATARTILDEVLQFPAHIIEQQLGHAVRDANGRAYNRTTNLPERKKMMQSWADYLEQLKTAHTDKGFVT